MTTIFVHDDVMNTAVPLCNAQAPQLVKVARESLAWKLAYWTDITKTS